jgi:hypothetical protein
MIWGLIFKQWTYGIYGTVNTLIHSGQVWWFIRTVVYVKIVVMCPIQILWRMKISNNNYNYDYSKIKYTVLYLVTILTLHWSILQLLWYFGPFSQCGKLQTEIIYYKPLLPRHMFQGNNIHNLFESNFDNVWQRNYPLKQLLYIFT